MANNVFIGLGGTGYQIVSRIQRELGSFRTFIGEPASSEDHDTFIYIDTDSITKKDSATKERYSHHIDLGNFKVGEVYVPKHQEILHQWFDPSAISIPDKPLTDGGKAIRQFARMAFYLSGSTPMKQFEKIFEQYLKDIKTFYQVQDNQNVFDKISLFIVSGSAGGTGSGIFLDVLQALRNTYYKTFKTHSNFECNAFIIMPHMFTSIDDPVLEIKYQQNGFAFLQELNAFVRAGEKNIPDQFWRYTPVSEKPLEANFWKPLKFCCLVDDINDKVAFPAEELFEAMSQFLFAFVIGSYYQREGTIHDSSGAKNVKDALFAALTNSSQNTNRDYIDFFSTFGIVTLKGSFEYFANYALTELQKRSIREMVSGTHKQPDDIKGLLILRIAEAIKTFNDTNPIAQFGVKPSRNERQEYLQFAGSVDFGSSIKYNGNNDGIKALASSLNNYREKLNELLVTLQGTIHTKCNKVLAEGYSIQSTAQMLQTADTHFYNVYTQKSSEKIRDDQEIDSIIQTKQDIFLAWSLSKGHISHNNEGLLDKAKSFYDTLIKDLTALEKKTSHDALIDRLNRINRAGVTQLVPPVDSILSSTQERIDENGPFAIELEKLQLSGNELWKVFFAEQYDQFQQRPLNSDKFIKTISEKLESFISQKLNDQPIFMNFKTNSIYQLLEYFQQDTDVIFERIKAFNTPFIQLNETHSSLQQSNNKIYPVTKTAYVGHFSGNPELREKLGSMGNTMDSFEIDTPYYKNKILKLIFKSGIAIDLYTRFNEYQHAFNQHFTSVRKNKLDTYNPFIHRSFAGNDFDGNVFNMLLGYGKQNAKASISTMNTSMIAELYKFGLLFLCKYLNAAKDTGLYTNTQMPVTYDETSKTVSFYEITYNAFLKKHKIGSNIPAKLGIDDPINIQQIKPYIAGSIKFLNQSTTVYLDDANELKIYEDVYDQFSFSDDLNQYLTSFADSETNKVFKHFLDEFLLIVE